MTAVQDEAEPHWMVATCHTTGCPAAGQPFTNRYYPNAAPPTYRGICMCCEQPITDLVPLDAAG